VDPERHLNQALIALADRYGVLRLSPLYENSPVGFDGDDFLNLVIAFETEEDVAALNASLAAIEAASGRTRESGKFSPRTLDLDLLLYGDLADPEGAGIPRGEILEYAFVLRPLAELCPDGVHPLAKRTFADLWSAFDKTGVDLRHRPLSVIQGSASATEAP
jgi:2-amino-4-hydroxy-6-hydroxymethyldihydropteridine diphosphokinase